ncbi:DUF1127 domain-containing protein [Desertibaculum subflavum]|uniref:DUF1127 domain-containing protein n=1 Tax=Desertibaculum subflavum TaxID=2268458 RepID=UPI000E66C53D
MRTRFERIGYRLPAAAPTTLGQRLRDDFKALGTLMLTWQQRARERHHLAALSEHMRRDLGLDEADIYRESRKPFWRS